MKSQPSAANFRDSPGATLRACIAASMANVPDPQNGSAMIRPGRKNDRETMAAASVSLIGAATSITR